MYFTILLYITHTVHIIHSIIQLLNSGLLYANQAIVCEAIYCKLWRWSEGLCFRMIEMHEEQTQRVECWSSVSCKI